jgi:hypothetical protein
MENHVSPDITSSLLKPYPDESDVHSQDIDENKLQTEMSQDLERQRYMFEYHQSKTISNLASRSKETFYKMYTQ